MKNYSRIITDLLPKVVKKHINQRYFALYLRDFLIIFFVLLIGVLLQLLVIINGRYMSVRSDFIERNREYLYWSSVALQYPNVPDILYNAALSSYAIGKGEEAVKLIDKVLFIDPLFDDARMLRSRIAE